MDSNARFKIANKMVGEDYPAFIIAEVAQAHDGSFAKAKEFIKTAASLGVDAIKFQTHIAFAESTLDEQFRVNFGQKDKTRFDYWRRMEFSKPQWQKLSDYAKSKGLIFLSSPFSVQAVDLLLEIGMPAWKIGSGECASDDMINAMIKSKKPILFSTGMSYMQEIAKLAKYLGNSSVPFAILQCTSEYPTPLEHVGLNMLLKYKSCYNCVVGLSDHSASIWPSIAAIAQGASIIEFHIKLTKDACGPDASSSLLPEQIAQVCEARDALFCMRQNPVEKDKLSGKLENMRKLFTKSIALKHDMKQGQVLAKANITFKKPGTGILRNDLEKVIGKKLKKDVSANKLLSFFDLDL